MPMDDFEAFRKKKEAQKAAEVAAKAAAEAAAEQQETGRPKGFRRGRYQKPPGPVQGVVPKRMRSFRAKKGAAAAVGDAKPRRFTTGRAEANPVDPAFLRVPEGFDRGREAFEPGKAVDVDPPPLKFESTRRVLRPLDPKQIPKPKGFRRY